MKQKIVLCLLVALCFVDLTVAFTKTGLGGRGALAARKKSGVTICKKLLAAKPTPKTAAELDTACDTYGNSVTFYKDYTKEKCKESVAPLLASYYAAGAAIDCDAMEDELRDLKSRWNFRKDKTDVNLQKRIGLEDELGGDSDASKTLLFLYNAAEPVANLKFGPTNYGQVITRTADAQAVNGIDLLQVTLDGIINSQGHGDAVRDALAAKFNFDPDQWGKDGVGTRGLIELVTGPVPNANIRILLHALQKLLDVIGQCIQCQDDYVGAGNIVDAGGIFGRSVKFEVVRTKFNALLVGPLAELAPYALEPLTTKLYGEVDLPGYVWLMKCEARGWSFTARNQNLQVNFGLPIASYAADTVANLVPRVNGEEAMVSKILKKAHSTTAAYLAASAMGDDAKNDVQVKGLFALIAFYAYGNTNNHCKEQATGVHLTADNAKGYFNLLPKINLPDIVRLLPLKARQALKTWFVGNIDAITDALYNAMWTVAEAARLPAPSWGLIPDPQKVAATNCFGPAFRANLRRSLERIFNLNLCPTRYVGETTTAYGNELEPKNRLAACEITAGIDKFVPVWLGEDKKTIWGVIEARRTTSEFNQQFIPKPDAVYTAAGFDINNAAYSEILALTNLQNA